MKTYSAAQLLAHIENDDPESSLRAKIQRERSQGVTHFLLVQREDETITSAALIPAPELLDIWRNQRDISARLIESGKFGSKKNHALNGSSPTLYLQDDRAREVPAALWNHSGVQNLVKIAPTMSVALPAEDADRNDSAENGIYFPREGDFRKLIARQIRERRGQQPFRDALRKRYGDRCLVTGCASLSVLEAAHIKPYRGEDDNHPDNGLLLRSDIHTLFDLDLIGIEPDDLSIELVPDPALARDYGYLVGKRLGCSPHRRPSLEALRLRYEQFRRRPRQWSTNVVKQSASSRQARSPA